MVTLTRSDAIDEVLTRVDTLGFEMGPGFTSHAPMGAEALVTLGYATDAVPWIDRYIREVPHFPRPEPTSSRVNPNDEADWRDALGRHERLADWVLLFEEEMENEPWADTLARWWPRLVDGFIGGLTHGLIRTAHAVRSLDAEPNPTPRLQRELARALAYMAVQYSPLPGRPEPTGNRSLSEAFAGLPIIPPSQVVGAGPQRRRGGRYGQEEGDALAEWQDAVNQLEPPADLDRALLSMSREAANILRDRAAIKPSPVQMIASVHVMTAPSAARMLLPHLPVETHAQTYARVWQVVAGLAAAFMVRKNDTSPRDDHGRQPLALDELRARAIDNRAAHAIKLTETCLRDYQDDPDPVYLFAAEDVLPRIIITDSTPGG